METLLILLGVMGFGAIILSVHVFSADSGTPGDDPGQRVVGTSLRDRNDGDRRSAVEVVFPLLINGKVVHEDRRLTPDRRKSLASPGST